MFSLRAGETLVRLSIWGFEDGKVWLSFVTWPIPGTVASPGAAHRLLAANHEHVFGAWDLDGDRDVKFRYVVSAHGLTEEGFLEICSRFLTEAERAASELNMLLLD